MRSGCPNPAGANEIQPPARHEPSPQTLHMINFPKSDSSSICRFLFCVPWMACCLILSTISARATVWTFTNQNSTAWTLTNNWRPDSAAGLGTIPKLGATNYPGRINVGLAGAGTSNCRVVYDSPLTTGLGTFNTAGPEFGRAISIANGTGTTGILEVVSGKLVAFQAVLNDAVIVGAPANNSSTSKGHLLLNGGDLTIIATNYGVISIPFRGNSNALGMVTVTNGSTLKSDRIRFGGTGAGGDIGTGLPGILNLQHGGTLHIRNIGNYSNPTNMRATNNFDGGTIKVLAAETIGEGKNPLIGSNIVNNILAGGVVVDTAGFNARVVSPFFSGIAGADGGITKTGIGTLNLLGLGSTYTGPTIVSQGTLGVQVPMTSSDFRVGLGAGLNFIPDNIGPWTIPSLGLTNMNLGFDYGIFAGYSSAVVSAGVLHLEGTITVNLVGNSFPITDLTLLTYGSKTGSGSFKLGDLPSGATATLEDTGSALVLHITKASLQSLLWSGGDGIWRTNGAANWNGGVATYLEYGSSGDIVTFDDTVGGTVSIPSVVTPASITVSGDYSTYVFSGAGGISGATGLDKLGTGSLQVDTSNDFLGDVVVSGGILSANNVKALGATNGGTLVFGSASTLALGITGGTGIAVTGESVTLSGSGYGGALGALRGAATTAGANVWAGPVIIGDSTARIGTEDGGNLTVSGNITDKGSAYPLLFRAGMNSTLVISGVSNYWGGNTTVFGTDSSSVVQLGADNAFPTNSLLLVGGNATLDLKGFSQTSAGLALATGGNTTPPVVTSSASLTILTLNPAANQTFPGDITGSISVVKAGTNTQTFTGATLSYSGTTLVSGGQLNLAGVGTMASAVTVVAGATLGGEGITSGTLTLNANSIVSVDATTPGAFTARTISASSSPIYVSFPTAPPAGTPVVVLSSSSSISGSPANFQALGVRGGSFSLANGNRDLMYTASPTSTTVTWKGDSLTNPTFWDILTTNWTSAGKSDRFFNGDDVMFSDSATSFSVSIQGSSVSPASVTVDNSANAYTIAGGAITGTGGMTKTGSGSLTMASANSYTGETIIKGGTLIAQSGAALGTVEGGTTVTNGGTLDVGGMNLGAEVVSVSGAGVGGNGVIVNNSGTDQINALQQVVLLGNATFGAAARWDLRGTGNTLDMGGFTLTKTGTNLVALVGSAIYNPGNIRIAQGTLGLHLATDLGGSAANTVTVQNGGTLNFYSCPSPNAWTLALENGSTYFSSVGGVGMNNWSGPISLQGSATLLANSPFDMTGDITGAGSITKTGAAVANLMANKYTGNTTVNEGRLYVQLPTFATNAVVTVANGAVLEMGFAETSTVAALILGGDSKPAGVYNSTTDPTYLAGSGSLRVVTSTPNPTDLKYTITGSALQFSWTGNYRLQAQTNTLNVGLSGNWADYPGGSSSPVAVPIDVAKGSVFFRLVYP